ncbi:DUF6150 family protein [Adhaeribacter pallidiroseus]|uniref:7(1) septoil knot domain-containing protein n=1 Tax=Adhaeribacter pallidiroseus TaxID=2072847 RepID=A0A369QPT8_9BACT|nr:DUF6150 family protein [Adhaeribacter pallidiroseus]RDC66400.1 hypothetical protein AHMF7616_05031 [Adhaeribacter pallidiroseus]
MLVSLLLSLFTFLGHPTAAAPTTSASVNHINTLKPAPEFCNIYGSVFLTSDPKYKRLARYTVYLEPNEAFANLVVFKEENKLFADKPGLWHPASGYDFADHVLYLTTNRAFADFSIYYTKSRSFAGCKE